MINIFFMGIINKIEIKIMTRNEILNQYVATTYIHFVCRHNVMSLTKIQAPEERCFKKRKLRSTQAIRWARCCSLLQNVCAIHVQPYSLHCNVYFSSIYVKRVYIFFSIFFCLRLLLFTIWLYLEYFLAFLTHALQ